MRRSMQMGQRLSILAYDVAETREETTGPGLTGTARPGDLVSDVSELMRRTWGVWELDRWSFIGGCAPLVEALVCHPSQLAAMEDQI